MWMQTNDKYEIELLLVEYLEPLIRMLTVVIIVC